MKLTAMTACWTVLSLTATSHAHPNHAGEIGHGHGGVVSAALLLAMLVLVMVVAAAAAALRQARAARQHVVKGRGLHRCPPR